MSRKYQSIKTTKKMRDDIVASIPILEKFIGQIGGNSYLEDYLYDMAVELYENANECKSFDIYDKDGMRVREWAYIEEVEALADGDGGRTEFDPPRKLLRIEFAIGAHIFGNGEDQKYYRQFIEEIKENVPPDYPFWGYGTMFYEPKNARKAVEITEKLLKKYKDGIEERRKAYEIEKLEAARARIDRNIAMLKGKSDEV